MRGKRYLTLGGTHFLGELSRLTSVVEFSLSLDGELQLLVGLACQVKQLITFNSKYSLLLNY
jgi:hypothetical protein